MPGVIDITDRNRIPFFAPGNQLLQKGDGTPDRFLITPYNDLITAGDNTCSTLLFDKLEVRIKATKEITCSTIIIYRYFSFCTACQAISQPPISLDV
jgi:hypothetical protein